MSSPTPICMYRILCIGYNVDEIFYLITNRVASLLENINITSNFCIFSLKEDYLTAVQGIIKRLVKHTPQKNLTFIGELKANTREFVPKMVSFVLQLI